MIELSMSDKRLEERIVSFVRAFGLHKNEETPCGKPLSVAEAYVLMELSRDGQLPQLILVERLNLAKSTVSRLLKLMSTRGWVDRTRDAQDRRAWRWQLTKKGAAVAADVARARRQKFDRILANIPVNSQERVLDSLNILVEAIYESTSEK